MDRRFVRRRGDDSGDDGGTGTTRRSALRAGAAALGTLGATALAGCTAGLPPLGSRVRYGRVDAPPAPSPDYRRWLPVASAFASDRYREDDYTPTYAVPGRLGGETLGDPFTLPSNLLKTRMDYFGVGYGNYDRVFAVGPVLVALGGVDPAVVARAAREGGYRPAGAHDGRHAGYDLFERSAPDRAVAVDRGGTALVMGFGDAPLENALAAVDAGRGVVRRHHEVDPEFAAATEAVGARPWTTFWNRPFGTDEPDGLERKATGGTFTTDGAYFVTTYLFESASAADRTAIERSVESNRRAVSSHAVDISVEGRVGTVEMFMPAGVYRRLSDSDLRVPQVTWGYDHDPDAGAFTLRHEAGDRIDADLLTLRIMGANGERDVPVSDRYERFGPGDAVTVEVGEGASVLTVRYGDPGSQEFATLFHYGFHGEEGSE